MNLNLSMPVKASLGASAAAGTSLAAAGAGGAFSSGAQLEKVEGDKENTSEDEVKNQDREQKQNIVEDSQHSQLDAEKVLDNEREDVQELTPVDSFYSEDNFSGLKTQESKVVTLVSQDQTHKYEKGTIGYRYSKFLVSVTGKEENKNIEWWNEKYTERYEEDYFKPFETLKEITKAYDEKLSEDSLNGLCHYIYKLKKTTDEIKQIEKGNSRSIWVGLWIFCSPEQYDPYFIGDSSSNHPNPKPNDVSYQFKNKLLSTSEQENDFIWEKLNYHFFTTEKVKDSYFKSFKDANTPLIVGKNPLKEECEKVYKIQKTVPVGANRPSDEALLKYCSLED